MKKIYSFLILSIFMLLIVSNLQAIPVEGTSSGIFVNPTGPSGMIVTGVGTNNFTWGNGAPFSSPPSSLSFAGNPFSVNTDDTFSFGTLDYFNGTIAAGTQANAVDLNVTLTLTSPSGIIEDFIYNLGLINTTNTGDPNASADIVNLPNSVPDSFFTVAGIDYTLEFLGFGEISGSGFITTIDNFHVLEGRTASAQLFGRVTSDFRPVPEPATMLLLGTGLAGLLGFGRKKIFKK